MYHPLLEGSNLHTLLCWIFDKDWPPNYLWVPKSFLLARPFNCDIHWAQTNIYTVSNDSESSLIMSDSAHSSIGTLKKTYFSICSGYLLIAMTATIKYSILYVGDASDITTNSNSLCCWKFVIYFMTRKHNSSGQIVALFSTHSTTAILSVLAGLLITSINQLHITDNRQRWWDSHIWKHSLSVM